MAEGFKVTMPKGSILEINANGVWNTVTEHNRQPLEVTNERIEDVKRMANGTLRKYYVADKRVFNTSWEMVPSGTKYLVDNANWGGELIKEFYYNAGKNAFQIKIRRGEGSNTHETATVIFSSFNYTIVKRGVDTFYNISLEMTEV